jgi:cytochrome b involved in lipid metabolism
MTSEGSYTDRDIASLVESGRKIVVLFGGVYDVTSYMGKHPGGKAVIEKQLGRDATEPFVAAGHLTKTRVVQLLAKFRIGNHLLEAKL